MSIGAKQSQYLSAEDYLAGEAASEIRHEYIDGQVYAMTGASRSARADRQCTCLCADAGLPTRGLPALHLRHEGAAGNRRPDVVLLSGSAAVLRHDGPRALFQPGSPCLIVEVLSESTERIDRREKLLAYQTLPSLREYLLVAQNRMQVELFRRSNDWRVERRESGELWLDCVSAPVTLADIYADVDRLA